MPPSRLLKARKAKHPPPHHHDGKSPAHSTDGALFAGQLALITAAVFNGAAIYISVAEQPSRLQLDDRALLTEWKPAYKRGTATQAPLAIIGFLFGALATWQTGTWRCLANWPFRLLGIVPTNKADGHRPRLRDIGGPSARQDLGSSARGARCIGRGGDIDFLTASL